MINCLLIDDDPASVSLMEENIDRVPFLNLSAICQDTEDVNRQLSAENLDLIFLDIKMPGINGLELIKTLPAQLMTIVTTTCDQSAVEAFKLNVVDYLLKPIPPDRFLLAASKAFDQFSLRRRPAAENTLSYNHLFVNAGYSMVKVRFQDISYIEGLRDYVKIHLVSGKPVITRISLRDLLEKLPPGLFMRIHKSFIISLNLLEAVQKYKVTVGDTEVPIGESYRNELHEYVGRKG